VVALGNEGIGHRKARRSTDRVSISDWLKHCFGHTDARFGLSQDVLEVVFV
jgi:hypothetical protein